MKFPTVPGRDTHGARLTLPDDLDGEQTLLVVSFHHRQQSLVGSWRQFAEELCERFEHFTYYELVIGGQSGMVPPAVNSGLSRTSATRRQHDNTIRVSVDKTAFRRRLGMVDERTIYTFLLEEDYVVRREAGILTPSVGEGLESLLESYRDAKHTCSNSPQSASESPG